MVEQQQRSRTPLWLLPNVLSLDTPLVALVWQDFLARCTESPLWLPARLVLGLTAWAIYLADRLLDVRRPAAGQESPRHSFYRCNRRFATFLLVVVMASDTAITVILLRPAVFHTGMIALAGVLLYLGAIHFGAGWRPPKELLVALLFVAGTFIVAWTWSQAPRRTMVIPAAVFFLLCLANVTAIRPGSGGNCGWAKQGGLTGLLCSSVRSSRCGPRCSPYYASALAGIPGTGPSAPAPG